MNDSDLKTMLFLATTFMACFVTISSSRVNIEVFLVLRFGNWWVRHFDWKTSGPPLFITCIAGFVINTSDTQSLITQNVSSLLCKDWKDIRCPPTYHSKWQCELFSHHRWQQNTTAGTRVRKPKGIGADSCKGMLNINWRWQQNVAFKNENLRPVLKFGLWRGNMVSNLLTFGHWKVGFSLFLILNRAFSHFMYLTFCQFRKR